MLSLYEWSLRHRRIDDHPFSLDRFSPLIPIYQDDHPFIVLIKPAQTGCSEFAINYACWALDQGAQYWGTGKAGLNVGYIFPTAKALSDFAKERFGGLKRESAYLAALFSGEYDDIGFKTIRESVLYLRGTYSEENLISFPGDVLILDEYDRMAPSAVALAEKRLRASEVKRRLYLSKPEIPGRGIDYLYKQSDQRIYEQPCYTCESWNTYDFFRDVRGNGEAWETWRLWTKEHLRQAEWTVHCPVCRQPADRTAQGRWTALRPDIRGIRGYAIPALAFPMTDLAELAIGAASPDPSVVTEFYRSDLGMAYEPGGSRVTEEMVRALSENLENGRLPKVALWRRTTMGVDVGSVFHYRITSTGPDGRRYVRAMGTVPSWSDVSKLLRSYKVRRCVVDSGPELHGAEEFASLHAGKVLRAYYPEGMGPDLFTPSLDNVNQRLQDGDNLFKVNRTMAMDRLYATIAEGLEAWPSEFCHNAEIIDQLKAPIRTVIVNAKGRERIFWDHREPDHYFHASVYDQMAELTLPRASSIGLGVVTSGGVEGWNP